MIDFVKLVYTHSNINAFLEVHRERLKGVFTFDNGEITFPFSFEIEGFKIEIKGSIKLNIHYINIIGSLHKNFYKGANVERFKFDQLKTEIHNLCTLLQLEPEKLLIQNLEIGVNVRTHFKPYDYLEENLILYKTKRFAKYDKGHDGKELGFYCKGLPVIKLYDKGKQHDTPYNLMRFELRYKKTAFLHRIGVCSIIDLMDIEKINILSDELLKKWNNVLLYESDLNTNQLTNKEKSLYKELEHPKNWIKLLKKEKSTTTFYNHKETFKNIIVKYGKNVHKLCFEMIQNEIIMCTNFPRLETDMNNSVLYDFPNTLKGNNVHPPIERRCKSCNKPLHPDQRKTSEFCSEKYVGKKEGKKCRNYNSNNRNKVNKIMSKGVLFPVNEMFDSNFIKNID